MSTLFLKHWVFEHPVWIMGGLCALFLVILVALALALASRANDIDGETEEETQQ
jgi:hypothetical protein